jgi:hypothetical protein
MRKTQTIKQRKALGTGSRKTRSRSPAAKPTADRFKDLNKRDVISAATALDRAFGWSDSREGHEYWNAVHLRLCQIAGADQMDGFHAFRPDHREMEWEDVDHFHQTNSVQWPPPTYFEGWSDFLSKWWRR